MFKRTAFLLSFFCATGSFAAHAQMADRLTDHPNAVQKASKAVANEAVVATRDMTNRLHLNEGQFLQLLPLNRTRLTDLHRIDREYPHDDAARTAKAAELEAQFEQECSRVLTPSQLSQLQYQQRQPVSAPIAAGNGLG